jgi:hypothetical protein
MATIQDNQVREWGIKRQEEAFVLNALSKGNTFTFTFTEPVPAIHAYLSWNAEEENVYMTLIKADQDTPENTTCIDFQPLSSRMKNLPAKSSLTDSKPMDWTTADRRIRRWNTQIKRDNWITGQFGLHDPDLAIFQAFVVNSEDFSIGSTHEVFLALKIADERGYYPDNLQPEIIIVDSNSNDLSAGNSIILDLTAPVPPFKPDPRDRTYQGNFGLLERLRIN